MNQEFILSVFTELRSICRQPLQHVVQHRVRLGYFCRIGAGLKGLALLATLILTLVTSPRWAASADKLRMGYTSPSITNAMLWIVSEGRIFTRNDLDVEIIYFPGNLAIGALIAGEIQAGQMTGALIAPARLQGADPLMLIGLANYLTDRFVVRPEIKSAKDLIGKRVAISRFGAVSHRATINLLKKLGLNPDKDVTILQIGDIPARLAALLTNRVDAAIIQPPDHKKAVEAGMRVLANMEEMDMPYQATGVVTTQSFIAAKPDVVRRIVKSFVEGIHLMRTNPEVSKRALTKYMKLKDEKLLDEAYQIVHGLVKIKPYPTLEGFKTILNDFSDRLPAARTANPKDFVDTRFLEELDRSGFIDALYR